MATISIDGGTLHVALRLWDKILSVHGSLRIPLAHVKSVSVEPAPPVPWFTKLIGANIPGVLAAGTFFTKGGLAFYDYGEGRECLILELDHERFVRAVVEIDPPQSAEQAAAQIRDALSRAAPVA
jgi:hypothetical protein